MKKCKKKIICKILKYIIFFISILLLIYFFLSLTIFKKKLCFYKINKLNCEINNNVNNILNAYHENLSIINKTIIDSQSQNLTNSQCLMLNSISKETAKIINDNIIDKKQGVIIDNKYLGILNYFCNECKINTKIVSKILLNDFLKTKNNKLTGNKYKSGYDNLFIISNLFQIINSISCAINKNK